MVRAQLGLITLAAAVGLGFAACSSEEDGGAPSSGGKGGSAGSSDSGKPGVANPKCGESGAATCIVPPEPPASGPTPPDTMPPTVVAISELFLGDTDRQGNPSETAWKQIGFNLDGLVSTDNGTNHCKLAEGANLAAKVDGEGGIDNAFGMALVPLIATVAMGPLGPAINDSIDLGDFTVMIRLQNLADPVTTPTQTGVKAAVVGGGLFSALVDCGGDGGPDSGSLGDGGLLPDGGPLPINCQPPKFDGTDVWPLARATLTGGNAATPKVSFANSFVVDGTWVSGPGAQLELTISIQGITLTLHVISAYIAVDLTGTQASAKGTNGTIAGVVNTGELIAEIRRVVGNADPALCTVFDNVVPVIRQASDIMSDGTNGDPTKTCDAISIGLGFDATAVIEGLVAPAVPELLNVCGDASQ